MRWPNRLLHPDLPVPRSLKSPPALLKLQQDMSLMNLSPRIRTPLLRLYRNQLLEIDFAFIAMVFVNRHLNRFLLIPIVIIEDAPSVEKLQDVSRDYRTRPEG